MRLHYYTQTVYAGYLSVGDVIHADNTDYHITAITEERSQDMTLVIVFSTREGQDLRYAKYADVYATFKTR